MPVGTQLDLAAHWDLIARGIYRRDSTLALYYEVERLHKVAQEQAAEVSRLETALAATAKAPEQPPAQPEVKENANAQAQ